MKDKSSTFTQMALFWVLVKKDLTTLYRTIWGRLINATILVLVQVLVMGYFLPLMGMPQAQIAPLYLVSVAQVLFFLGFNLCLTTVLDLKNRRAIEYFLILPLSKSWYMATQIVSFMIEGFLISFPLVYDRNSFIGLFIRSLQCKLV